MTVEDLLDLSQCTFLANFHNFERAQAFIASAKTYETWRQYEYFVVIQPEHHAFTVYRR